MHEMRSIEPFWLQQRKNSKRLKLDLRWAGVLECGGGRTD
jgi:hypothetical protein